MKKLSKETVNKILLDYKKGHSIRYINRLMNVSVGSIHKYLSEYNLLRKQNIVKKLNSKDERLLGLYVGLWMGDGTQYWDKSKRSYTVKVCCNKKCKLLNAFIMELLIKLFDKKSNLIEEKNTNQACIRFESKFIYNFVYEYIGQGNNKTYTVCLRNSIKLYNKEFLEGCLLGLVLSDGYLKYKFNFNVTSPSLANNIIHILNRFGFSPRMYVHDRRKYGWQDLYMVSLKVDESRKLRFLLDRIIKDLGYDFSFNDLKYEK